ncbi:MAG: transglycosylase domain-containing protein [Rickettsiales bacterium]|nr:transglycosylase domain-containing protein [Rickettsiales bacterium]
MKKQQKNKNQKDEKKPISVKWRFMGFLATLCLCVFVLVAGYFGFVFLTMPSLDTMLNESRAPAITFIDKDGYEIRSTGKIMGTPVSVQSLPPYVWQSIVAIEDKRFFNHGPVDFRSLARAVITNLRLGYVGQGGSTITQQVAKNIFLTPRRTIQRKAQEIIISYWLENKFTKEQILDLYMNRVSLVRGMRGIDAAARDLFQKTADDLTLGESAQIAAMLKAPTAYSPVRNPEKNIERARVVLTEMVRQNYISLDDARDAAASLTPITPIVSTNNFRYWTDFVMDELVSRTGNTHDSDLFVYTTLDSELQDIATFAAQTDGKSQIAITAMDSDGAILAMIGGRDYNESQFNRVLSPRQPGSAFKPIVYLVALENGMTPDDIVNDSVFVIGNYNPKNYNEKYYGDISLRDAFAKSVNSVPLKLTHEFGIDSVLKMARRLGVGANLRREYSTILGACEMSLLDLTAMNVQIWNGGIEIHPYSILRIVAADGRVLYSRNTDTNEQIINSDIITQMQNLMSAVIRNGGTGTRAAGTKVRGGKTGTSNDNRDAWFIGAVDDLVIGVWVGNDDNSPMDKKITGGTIPAEVFHKITEKKF